VPDESFYKQPTLPDITSEKPFSPLPQKIGPYKIEGLLNKGGMSLLYLGLHPETRQPLAIKVLSPEYVTNHEAVERFLKEAKIIGLTSHPNIVKLYGQGEWEGGLYIAMELIRGVSLRQFIMQQSLSLKRSLDIILQVAYALLHLHTHGVIHRDLKPENILITEDGEVKVIDFGIAGLHEDLEAKAAAAAPKRIMGTPHYMSPEQKDNLHPVSYVSDIYSLGIIAYELVLGKLSYGMVNLSLLPKGLRKIIGKALAVSVNERYQDIVDFITDISQYIKSGEWEKDRPGTDQVKELLETIQTASFDLSPLTPPRWPEVEIGLAKYKSLGQLGLYYDFFRFPNNAYAVFLSVSSSNGIDGAIYSGVLRGEVRAYVHQKELTPLEPPTVVSLLTVLNHIYHAAPLEQQYALSFLILDPVQNQLSFASLGLSSLYHISAGSRTPNKLTASNPPLGAALLTEFSVTNDNWNYGDTVILHTLQSHFSIEPAQEEPSFFEETISEYALLSAQNQAEAILKKCATHPFYSIQRHPRALLSLQRIG
jgi:eukaryotic-like serine/threonine-protein kinase